MSKETLNHHRPLTYKGFVFKVHSFWDFPLDLDLTFHYLMISEERKKVKG